MLRLVAVFCVCGLLFGPTPARADMIFFDNFGGSVTEYRTRPFTTDTGDPTNSYQRVDLLPDGTARTLIVTSLNGLSVTGYIGGGAFAVEPTGPYLAILDYNFGGINLATGEYGYERTLNFSGSPGIRIDVSEAPLGAPFALAIGFGDGPTSVGGSVVARGTLSASQQANVPLSAFTVKEHGYLDYNRVAELALMLGSDIPLDPTLRSVGVAAADAPPVSAVPAPPAVVLAAAALPIVLLWRRTRRRTPQL